MSRRKKKPAYNPRSGSRQEVYARVRAILRCEDKWKDHAAQIGLMIEQERDAVAKMEDADKRATATTSMDKLYAAYLGWVAHFNALYQASSEKADEIGCAALETLKTKGVKWADMELILTEPLMTLTELEAEMTNTILTATQIILPAIAEYQLATGDGKDNAEMAEMLSMMQAEAPKLPEPGFEEVAENETREDRADDAFDRAAQ